MGWARPSPCTVGSTKNLAWPGPSLGSATKVRAHRLFGEYGEENKEMLTQKTAPDK